MRALPIAAIAAASIVLPAAAQNSQNSGQPRGSNSPYTTGQQYNGQQYNGQQYTGQQYSRNNGQPDASCANQAAWTGQMSQRLAQNGYTNAQQMPQAFVIHAIGPDGVPVVMLVAPVQDQQ